MIRPPEAARARPAPAPGPTGAGRVRPLVEGDIPAVAALHARVFGAGAGSAAPALRDYLGTIFCRHPWADGTCPSLVYEAGGRGIVGVLGVMRRPMSLRGRSVQAAVSHDFMVDPCARTTPAAMELVRAFLAGPQDLSLADGNAASRKVWAAFGGLTAPLYSLRWTRPLRPAGCALRFLGRRGLAAAVAARPLAAAVDAVATRVPGTPLYLPAPRVSGSIMTAETLLACLGEFFGARSLRPVYDAGSLAWLLEVLGRRRPHGAFHRVVVRDGRGRVLGWYLYYQRPGGVGEVVQLGAPRDSIGEVLAHLFHDAWRGGALAVSGQLDPVFAEALSASHCVFDHSGFSMLIQARESEVLDAIHRGDALLTRLEGEGWMRLAFAGVGA